MSNNNECDLLIVHVAVEKHIENLPAGELRHGDVTFPYRLLDEDGSETECYDSLVEELRLE